MAGAFDTLFLAPGRGGSARISDQPVLAKLFIHYALPGWRGSSSWSDSDGTPMTRYGLARARPHASAADGRPTAAAASRVAAVRETQRAAGPRAASAVMMTGEIARLKPVDS